MKTKKTLISAMLSAAVLALSLAGCGGSSSSAPSSASQQKDDSASAKYTVGICQLTQHPSLDAATQGFMDAIEEALPNQVKFDLQNASNDIPTCGIICNGFAASNVDLILANATPSLQAASSATVDIPILGTAVTEYGVALDLDNFNGVVGGNISGTCDLAPLDQQANIITELFPEVKKVGILYCSAEANSVYQAQVVQETLEKSGITATPYTFSDSNDVSTVTATACAENDAIYIPTDNTAASCAAAINNVAGPAGTPIISGDADTCRECGIASFCIDYYELGRITGNMAVQILTGEKKISEMPIEYYTNPVKMYNKTIASSLNVTIPDDYTALD